MSHAFLARMFAGEMHHLAGYHQELRRCLPEAGRALDLGCGANEDLARYRSDQREVWGTDFEAHPHLQHAAWFRPLHPDGGIPFADASFDVIASLFVLEHVVEPAVFLGEVARVLRPGGCFVAHTISGSHYVTWLRRVIGLLPHRFNQLLVRRLYGRETFDTFPAYYRLNTKAALNRLGQAAGLKLERLQRYPDPGYFRFSKPLLWLAITTDWLLDQAHPALGRLYVTATFQKDAVSVARAA